MVPFLGIGLAVGVIAAISAAAFGGAGLLGAFGVLSVVGSTTAVAVALLQAKRNTQQDYELLRQD